MRQERLRLAVETRARAAGRLLQQRNVPERAIEIMQEVAEAHGCEVYAILSDSRHKRLIPCRDEAIYRVCNEMRVNKKPNLKTISEWFGKDHTSMIVALGRYAERTGAQRLTKSKKVWGVGSTACVSIEA